MKMEEFSVIYNVAVLSCAFFALMIAITIDKKKRGIGSLATFFSLTAFGFFFYLFGFRSVDIGTDTEMYFWQYKNFSEITDEVDFLMQFVFGGLNKLSSEPTIFFAFMTFLYLSTFFYALSSYAKRLQINNFLVIFSFISLFFFQSLGINIIRQGVSLGFFVLAMTQYYNGLQKKLNYRVILPLIAAVGFHFTSLIPIIIFTLVVIFKKSNLKYYYLIYLLCLILSIFNVSILDFKNFIPFLNFDERRSSYLDAQNFENLYSMGFKLQFVVFNSVFLLIFIYIKRFIFVSEEYVAILKYFIATSALLFLVFQLPYSDRWGVMSWIVIPFLLAPFFKSNTNSKLATLFIMFLTSVFIFFQNYA